MLYNRPRPLEDVVIGNHPVERYEYWRGLLKRTPVRGLSSKEELRLWMLFAAPCDTLMPECVVQQRLKNHDGVQVTYWRCHPWRFVVYDNWRLFTVEPDAYPHLLGVWRDVKEVRWVWGDPHDLATVEEIARGAVRNVNADRVNQGGLSL